MAESLHDGGVTWLGGIGDYFGRFDQIGQPNSAGIGTRQSGTADTHQRVRYASKACATKMLMLNKTAAAAMTSPITCLLPNGESSTCSFPDDFAELGKWFRRPSVPRARARSVEQGRAYRHAERDGRRA
jgi:hypothetical protein